MKLDKRLFLDMKEEKVYMMFLWFYFFWKTLCKRQISCSVFCSISLKGVFQYPLVWKTAKVECTRLPIVTTITMILKPFGFHLPKLFFSLTIRFNLKCFNQIFSKNLKTWLVILIISIYKYINDLVNVFCCSTVLLNI